ncbi:MAG: alpha/beta fold hydrolase [Myxococcales bacterium]|nr:alpha/beta fold hydrolase [Myxococcales bacterium]
MSTWRVQYARRGRHRIAYSLRGSTASPPLLMLRGLGRTSRHWGRIVHELEKGFRLILIDNRGVGRSGVPLVPFTTRDMADDAAWVLRTLGVERAHVLGISLGGMIAQELALGHAERLRSLILGCTTPGRRLGKGLRPGRVLELVAPRRLPPERAIRETARLILSDDFLAREPEVIDEWVEIARQVPPSRRGVVYQLIAAARHEAGARLAGIRAPTLVVTGDADKLIDAENSARLAAAIPGARLAILPGAGHDFPTEEPEATAKLINEFCLG